MTCNTLLLRSADIVDLLSMQGFIDAVEEAFRLHSSGQTLGSQMMHIDAVDGEFHVKAGGLELDRRFVGLKINGDFPNNVTAFGMPNAHGIIVLCDGQSGYPVAIVDSRTITLWRTSAATAVAVKYLANPNVDTITICGSGAQAKTHILTLGHMLALERAYIFSRNEESSQKLASEASRELGIIVEVVSDLKVAMEQSGVCITCTRSEQCFLSEEYVSPGTLIAAVGSDSPHKQELDPRLLISNTVVTDISDQCARVGELHHALDSGMSRSDVYAELGEIVSGEKQARRSVNEIIIFDSTGTAFQDLAAAVAIYNCAIRTNRGQLLNIF